MTFERTYVLLMAVAAVGFLVGRYDRWDSRVRRRRRERLIERLGRDRGW